MDLHSVRTMQAELQSALINLASIEERIFTALQELTETEIRLRRARTSYFPPRYFSDVAWDILLELDRSERLGQDFSVSDLATDANIPISTLLRYVAKLESDGFVVRKECPDDGRRVLVEFSSFGRDAFRDTMNAAMIDKTERLAT